MINVDGSGERALVADATSPSWSPDGAKIAFAAGGISTITLGGNYAALTDNGLDGGPAWSPDGTRLAFSRFDLSRGTAEIYTMNADGSNQVSLTDNDVTEFDPAWSPDGSRLAFSRIQGDQIDIHTISVDGTDERNITATPSVDEAGPDWQPLPNEPPDCSGVTASPASLRHHGFQTVTLSGATDLDGDAVAITITGVTQDEPVGRRPDARSGASPDQVELRAQRRPRGDGRVYRIAFIVSDGAPQCSGVATAEVRRSKKQPAVDSAPPSYDSFGG